MCVHRSADEHDDYRLLTAHCKHSVLSQLLASTDEATMAGHYDY